jgi:hypothetical protein
MITVSFLKVVCDIMIMATFPARRPSAGAVPVKGLLGGKDLTGRFSLLV